MSVALEYAAAADPAIRASHKLPVCRMGAMARQTLSVDLDERILNALSRAAVADGVRPDEVVAEALSRYFGLRGLAVMADIRDSQRVQGIDPPDGEELMATAVSEVRAYRERRRAVG